VQHTSNKIAGENALNKYITHRVHEMLTSADV